MSAIENPIINIDLLQVLLESRRPISIDWIAQQLGWPHTQIQPELDRIREAGCKIEQHPYGEIQLIQTGLGAWKDYLQARVGQLRYGPADDHSTPRLIQVYQSTHSTQDVARALLDDKGNSADGTLVIADHQTKGRGRLGRLWTAPAGTCILFSMVRLAQPSENHQSVNWLSAVSAVAVAIAIENAVWYYQDPMGKELNESLNGPPDNQQAWVRIKWPNDLIVGSGKLCGILVESVQTASGRRGAIIGVGANVSWDAENLSPRDKVIADHATSLAMQGKRIDRLPLAAAIIRQMDRCLGDMGPAELLEHWRLRSTLLGETTRLRSDGQDICGQVIDMDPHDGLIVRTTGGQVVHLRAETTTVIQ